MNEPSLSVVMNVHNGMPFVEESVRAILAQSYTDLEFIIGDDGSFDGSSEVLQHFASLDPRIRLLRRERKSGLAHSANWVIASSRAPLIAIAHADDVSLPDRLRKEVEVFAAEPEAVLAAALCEGIDNEGHVVHPAHLFQLGVRRRFAPFAHSSIMFLKSAWLEVGGYRPEAEYWEDLDLYYRLARWGRIFVVAETLSQTRYARTSARLKDRADIVEKAVHLMYRASSAQWTGGDPDRLIMAKDKVTERLHPRIFVARSWSHVWNGQRPGILPRMLERSHIRPVGVAVSSFLWVVWAELHPRSLRFFLRWLMHFLNRLASRRIKPGCAVEWHSRTRA